MHLTPSDPPILRTHHLSRRFGSLRAVDGLDLAVPRGGVYGFLGPNGAGKTTTIRLLLGLLRADAGHVELFGERLAPHRRRDLLRRVGALVEDPSLYSHLSGRENLEVTRRLLRAPRARVGGLLAKVGLAEAADRPVRNYSLGMRQRLGLALALLGEPELLILDEPTNGLDPAGIREMRELIRRLSREEGVTIFLSSHLLGEIEQVADRLGIVRGGRLVFEGSLDALRERRRGEIVLGVDRPQEAGDWLRRRGWSVAPPREPADRLRLAAAEPGAVAVAELNGALVRGGFRVHHLTHERPNLESLFLDLTESPAEAA